VTSAKIALRIGHVAQLLRDAERPIRVLRTIAWPPEVKTRFFAARARALPRIHYQRIDPRPTLQATSEARRHVTGRGPIDHWLRRQIEAIEVAARMLGAMGTAEFSKRSRQLYGAPQDPLIDQVNRPLDLAVQLDRVLSGLTREDLGAPSLAPRSATQLAAHMRRAVKQFFGAHSPEVVIASDLAANVVAGPAVIRVRRGARFTDKEIEQLIQHEAYVHVATALNGRAQAELPILAAAHAGTTRTQEGLAVFAELISGSLAPGRFARLADRVLAIHMAMEGADFLDVYRFFLDRVDSADEAFENARRIFRGGVLTGGAPFTKDVVYLDGLLRVHNFLRAVVGAGRIDCLRLLFCGKLDIEDMPALCELAALGLCRPPVFLPPWAADLRYLVAYLAYSGFLNRVRLGTVRAHYDKLLANAPVVS
jgi:uncharacterized protein (TIGR02421 family)